MYTLLYERILKIKLCIRCAVTPTVPGARRSCNTSQPALSKTSGAARLGPGELLDTLRYVAARRWPCKARGKGKARTRNSDVKLAQAKMTGELRTEVEQMFIVYPHILQ